MSELIKPGCLIDEFTKPHTEQETPYMISIHVFKTVSHNVIQVWYSLKDDFKSHWEWYKPLTVLVHQDYMMTCVRLLLEALHV
jgi:hypothetical protein